MTNPAASATAPRRSRSTLAVTAGIVAVLLIAFFVFAALYADVLWYRQVDFLSVLATQWTAVAVLFAVGFLAMAVPVYLAISLAYRFRPVYAQLSAQLDRYQQVVEPLRRVGTFAVPAVIGLFAAVSAATRWPAVLLFLNRTGSGTTDPQFGLDVTFYMFDLPFWRGVVAFASGVVLVAGLATLVVTYLYGAIRIAGREFRATTAARVQIALLAGLYLLLQAVSIFLDQFAATVEASSSGLGTGAGYTDVNFVIPGRLILAVLAAVVALLFFVAAFIGRWRLPVIGTALFLVAALVVGSVVPWVVQRFNAGPNVGTVEIDYIQRNIDATRDAYGVSDIETIPYQAVQDVEPGQLREDADTTANIRIIDPGVISPTFQQFQRFRQYYGFRDDLDVDRYTIDGETTDTVIGIRQLDQSGLGADQTAFNNTFVYTHGYGLVAAAGNQRSDEGTPVFLASGIPQAGQLGEFEPRTYFDEDSPEYSIVGAPEGTAPQELDYPSGGADADSGGEVRYTFTGDGGPSVGGFFNRLVYALKFQSEQILLSDAVNESSQILYDRNPIERVQKAAPYLTLDSDPYPTVVDGRIVWVVDGYTTSSSYPYSQVNSLNEAITDTFTPVNQQIAVDQVNYIRNSVKATVDAYDGSVSLYAWDDQDPVLQSWMKVFPDTVQPMSEMSADLMSHVRYPQDLFKVQRTVLGTYHVEDASSFYQANDAWRTPEEPTFGGGDDAAVTTAAGVVTQQGSATPPQPPYYLTMQLPGQDVPSYSLYSTYIPAQRGAEAQNILTGYLSVDSDAGTTAGERAASYGTLRLLELPRDTTVPGVGQVQNQFTTAAQDQLALLARGDTEVIRGNLLTLPVGGGLLYVQPVYIQSTGGTTYPILRAVLAGFGTQVAFEPTLSEALDELFGGDSGTTTPDDGAGVPVPDSGEDPTTDPDVQPTQPTTPVEDPDLAAALAAANQALQDRAAAYAANDLVAAAEADQRLQEAIEQAIAAQG